MPKYVNQSQQGNNNALCAVTSSVTECGFLVMFVEGLYRKSQVVQFANTTLNL